MALLTAYLIKTSNLPEFFNTLQTAKAPERFTTKFLKDLGFTSSNDRLYLGVLKGLGFIDENGTPTQTYFEFLDQSNSGRILAESIEEAYSDLFELNKSAQKMETSDVKGKFRSLTQGQKSDTVINNMASTFSALCDHADWSKPRTNKENPTKTAEKNTVKNTPSTSEDLPELEDVKQKLQLHYNIQLILPNSRDTAVYDAFFSSLKKHLL